MTTQISRSTTNRMVSGVAGGVAEAFGWDATLVRLGFVLLTLAHGGGLLLYIVLMVLMPKLGEASVLERATAGVEQAGYRMPNIDRNRKLGYVLVGVGVLLLANMLNISGPIIALVVIGGGYYLLKQR